MYLIVCNPVLFSNHASMPNISLQGFQNTQSGFNAAAKPQAVVWLSMWFVGFRQYFVMD